MLTTEQLRELADRLIEQVGYLDFNHHRNVMPPATLCAEALREFAGKIERGEVLTGEERDRLTKAEARVAELETGGGLLVLWWFLNDNPDQPMPPGANPAKQAIEAIQALRAEVTRLTNMNRSYDKIINDANDALATAGQDAEDTSPAEKITALKAERDRLAERLPMTADGVRLVQGDTAYDINGNECEYWEHCRGCECDWEVKSLSFDEVASHYSTRAAAEAARTKGGA